MLCNNTNELFHVCTPCEVFDARETSFLLAVDLLFFGVLGEGEVSPHSPYSNWIPSGHE